MNNAAIIVFRRSNLPKVLKLFALPHIKKIIETNNAEDKVRVYIIDCPVMNNPMDNRKLGRSLYGLFRENNISFFMGRNIECYLGSGLEYLENNTARGNTEEIKAIKAMAALIRLSGEEKGSLIDKYMCFVGKSYGFQYINTISEEAAGVYIYEYEGMKDELKKTIFEGLMSEKGISAVFSKDLNRALSQCEIIFVDKDVGLEAIRNELSGKMLIGENPAEGSFEKVSRVLLWYDSLEKLTEDNDLIYFNDELLGILRHFYREKSSISFIKKFPFILLY